MSRGSRLKKKRNQGLKKMPVAKLPPVLRGCLNCGGQGPHFVPPSFGDPGFYICERIDV